MNKTCSTCKEIKDCSEFGRRAGVNDGYSYVCKSCKNASARKRYEQNPKYNRDRSLRYYYQNKQTVNPKQAKRRKERRDNDLFYRIKCNVRSMVSQYLSNYGMSKKSRTYEIIGCDYESFIVHLLLTLPREQRIDFIRNRGNYHIDHIIPISFAKDEVDLIILNHYSNLQLLTARDNLRKSNKYEENSIYSR